MAPVLKSFKKRWQVFVLGNIALLLVVPFSMTYYDRLLASGTLPSDGDSISIPIGMNTMGTIFFLPVLNIIIWFATKNYVGSSNLFKWSFENLKQWMTNIITILMICFFLLCLYADITYPVPAFEWVLFDVLWIYFVMNLRAAILVRE